MYVKYKNKKYPCKCSISNETIRYNDLPEDFPDIVQGDIVLCADDGFELRTDDTKDYARQIFENGTLTLTNVPEKEIVDEPEVELEEKITLQLTREQYDKLMSLLA